MQKLNLPSKIKKKNLLIFSSLLALFLVLMIFVYHKYVPKQNTASLATTTQNKDEPQPNTVVTKDEIVCIDPGHGGKDTGVDYKNITEADINLRTSLQLKSILESDGYRVFMTRSDDTFVYKRDRARYCNSINASIMISVHHNSYAQDVSVDYSTALYYKDSDQALASSILSATSGQLGTRDQGIAKFDNSMLYIATMPAAMSEAFFVTNSTEYKAINQTPSARISAEAKALALGITNYFKNPKAASITTDVNSLIIDRSDYGD